MAEFPFLYEFNEAGLDAFEKAFGNGEGDSVINPTDGNLSAPILSTTKFNPVPFATSKDMAKAILHSLGDNEMPKLLPNTGLWAWLAFVLRDQLFKKDGTLKPGDRNRWYPSDPGHYMLSKRHLVRMPVLLRDRFGDDADHLLCGPPFVGTDIREQLTSQQDMLHPTFQKVARILYFDDASGKLKPGVGSHGKPGVPRRLAKVRLQLDVTWDLEDLTPEDIIKKLPSEFDGFKPK